MFPHLGFWLIARWTSSVTGAVVIRNLSLGPYTLGVFLWAVVAGLAVGLPAALPTWVRLRPNRTRQVDVFDLVPPDRR